MQILDVPYTHHDMTYSLSLTGVTMLTGSRYKTRHTGASRLVQVPRSGFIDKRQYNSLHKSEMPVKKRRVSKKKTVVITPIKKTQVRTYTIDKKQVRHRVLNYVNQMKGEKLLYFWTVTFPVNTDDDTTFRLFNIWLTRLRKECMIKEYLWVTERQENGTLHYHICINNRMDVKKANRFMRASIMHSINTGTISWSRTAASKYNGVDIAKDRKTRRVTNFAKQNKKKSLANYLTKYISKNEHRYQHLAWHCSRGYSNIIIAVRLTSHEFLESFYPDCVDLNSPLCGEWYIHFTWIGSPPPLLLKYLAEINQSIGLLNVA